MIGATHNDIGRLAVELDKARHEHRQAEARYKDAKREEQATLRTLDEAQKAFDAAVDATRADAPFGTKWGARSLAKGIPE